MVIHYKYYWNKLERDCFNKAYTTIKEHKLLLKLREWEKNDYK